MSKIYYFQNPVFKSHLVYFNVGLLPSKYTVIGKVKKDLAKLYYLIFL